MDFFNKHIETMISELNSLELADIDSVKQLFLKYPRVIFCTMGKSAFACAKVVYTARSYGLDWHDLDVCHAFHGDAGIIKDGDLLVFVSKSGETKEVIEVAEYFHSWPSIAVTSVTNSSLAELCDELLLIDTKDEGSPFGYAPMVSTTLYMIILHAILAFVVDKRGVKIEEYARNHPGGSIGKKLKLDSNLSPKNSF